MGIIYYGQLLLTAGDINELFVSHVEGYELEKPTNFEDFMGIATSPSSECLRGRGEGKAPFISPTDS